jgi:hypothetical protein
MPDRGPWHSPPTVARRYGRSVDWVYSLIKAGALRAINAGVKAPGKKRLLISEQSLEDFEQSRTTTALPVAPRRRRRPTPAGWVEFF